MPEVTRESVGLPWIGGRGGKDRRKALQHKLMLGVISAMLGGLLQGCTANKQASQDESNLANAAKDVAIPLEAGKKQDPLPATDEVVSQGQVLAYREPGKELRVLKGAGQTTGRPNLRTSCSDVLAVEEHLPGIRLEQP